MDFLFTLFAPILGIITRVCYSLVGNVGVSIIIFTLIVKILMFPLSVKQQKTTSKSQLFAPRLREIQTKYRGNQQKMQEEMAKLQKQGYNPASGCLPMVATMLILFGVLGVVYKPMTYFEQIDGDKIAILREISVEVEYDKYLERQKIAYEAEEIELFSNDGVLTEEDQEELLTALKKKYEDAAAKEKSNLEVRYNALQGELLVIGTYKNNTDAFKKVDKDTLETLKLLEKHIVFMGIDFSQMPSTVFGEDTRFFSPILLIPILAFLFAAGQMVITQIIQKKTSPESLDQMGGMKYMMYFMPVLSLVIAFQFPAGAGFYWALSSALGIVQSLIIYKIWPPDKLKAEVREALEKKGYKESDNVVVIEKHDGRTTTKKESEMSASERKEYYRKKLDEARKSDLEKYGEIGAPAPNTDNDNSEK